MHLFCGDYIIQLTFFNLLARKTFVKFTVMKDMLPITYWAKFYGLAILLILMVQGNSHAQEDFLLKGVVFERDTKIRVALAEVINKRTRFSVGTNDMGFFSINVKVGDTLEVIKRNFYATESVVKNTQDVVLFLNQGNLLNEVNIIGQTKKKELQDIRKDFRGKGTYFAGKPPVAAFLFSPLTALYELFGKTPQQAKRFNRMYETEMQNSLVDQFFNKALIIQRTGLHGEALDNFLMNYRPDYEKAKNWSSYDGVKWINDSYKKYLDTAKTVK